MPTKSSIHVQWTKGGRMTHRITGVRLIPPRDDAIRWILAPSPSLLLAHQFGVLKPSHALTLSAQLVDMLFYNRYLLSPINSALKAARIDFQYTGSLSVRVQFHPYHSLFVNNDSLEEGARQFLSNYTHYVYSQVDEYTRIVMRTMSVAAIGTYYDLVEQQLQAGLISSARDAWFPSNTLRAHELIAALSSEYYVPRGGLTPENERWALAQVDFLEGEKTRLEARRTSLFLSMGLV